MAVSARGQESACRGGCDDRLYRRFHHAGCGSETDCDKQLCVPFLRGVLQAFWHGIERAFYQGGRGGYAVRAGTLPLPRGGA